MQNVTLRVMFNKAKIVQFFALIALFLFIGSCESPTDIEFTSPKDPVRNPSGFVLDAPNNVIGSTNEEETVVTIS